MRIIVGGGCIVTNTEKTWLDVFNIGDYFFFVGRIFTRCHGRHNEGVIDGKSTFQHCVRPASKPM